MCKMDGAGVTFMRVPFILQKSQIFAFMKEILRKCIFSGKKYIHSQKQSAHSAVECRFSHNEIDIYSHSKS